MTDDKEQEFLKDIIAHRDDDAHRMREPIRNQPATVNVSLQVSCRSGMRIRLRGTDTSILRIGVERQPTAEWK